LQFHPMDDAMVHEAYPTKNSGHAAYVEVDRREEGGEQEAYLKFNVTGVSGLIKEAKLYMTAADIPFADSDESGLPYLVSDTTWSETSINWITRPPPHSTPIPSNKKMVVEKNQTVVFDLTSAISKDGLYSFAIRSGSTNGVAYNTKESQEKKPVLVITWEKQPKKDTTVPAATLKIPQGSVVSPR